jgi:hypothetical protein
MDKALEPASSREACKLRRRLLNFADAVCRVEIITTNPSRPKIGSGFICGRDQQLFLLTNDHVLSQAKDISMIRSGNLGLSEKDFSDVGFWLT